MWKWFAVAALVVLTGCADRQVASCATPMGLGTVGPCWDGTDRTDRSPRDDLTDRTDRKLRDDLTDRTDRSNRDDTTDRTVWCVEPAMVIVAPSFMVFFDWDKSDLSAQATDTISAPLRPTAAKGGAQIKASRPHRPLGPRNLQRGPVAAARKCGEGCADPGRGAASRTSRVVGLGESQPLVPTADGVREAQNRRVEIVLR